MRSRGDLEFVVNLTLTSSRRSTLPFSEERVYAVEPPCLVRLEDFRSAGRVDGALQHPPGTQMRSPKPPNDEVATIAVTSSFGGLGARLRWAKRATC